MINSEHEESEEEVKNVTTNHLPYKENERGKKNMREMVNELVGEMGRMCSFMRGPTSRQREGSMGLLLLGSYTLKYRTIWLVVKPVWRLTVKLIQSYL